MSGVIEVKVCELQGAALDWAVAKAINHPSHEPSNNPFMFNWLYGFMPRWSSDWSEVGPLIDDHDIEITSEVNTKTYG